MHKVLLSGLLSLLFGCVAAAQPVPPRPIPYSMLGASNGVATLDCERAPFHRAAERLLRRSRANLPSLTSKNTGQQLRGICSPQALAARWMM